MGNVLDVTVAAGDEDIKWLNVPNSNIFNDSYINGEYENLPKFDGTDVSINTQGDDPTRDGTNASKIKLERLLEIFSNMKSEARKHNIECYSNLDEMLSKWNFTSSNKMRARLLLRIHLALLREAESKQRSDDSENCLSIASSSHAVDDPNALLTASSVRMSLAMVKSLGPLKPELYRVVAEAMMDLFRRSSDMALSKVEEGSLQADTVKGIMEYAEDMTKSREGLGPEDRAQALALMLAVAVTSGSVRDVLSVVTSLQSGTERLPPSAATFLDRLRSLRTDLRLSSPSPATVMGSFKASLSPPMTIPDDQLDFTCSSVCTNGVHLFLWNGLDCTITKVGTGYHNTIAGGHVSTSVNIEKHLRERLKDDVYEERAPVALARPRPGTNSISDGETTFRRIRVTRKTVGVRTSPGQSLVSALQDSDENSVPISEGFQSDILGEQVVSGADLGGGTSQTFYLVEENLWIASMSPEDEDGNSDSDEDSSDSDGGGNGNGASQGSRLAVEITGQTEGVVPGTGTVGATSSSTTGEGAASSNVVVGGTAVAGVFRHAWLVYANGKIILRMRHLLGPYRIAIFSLALKLEDIVEISLPPIPQYMKMKKVWEDKRRGGLAEVVEEEDPEAVEWVLGEEINYAVVGHGAQVKGASSNFASSDGSLEKNLLLPSTERQPLSDETDTRYLFADGDESQHLVLDLGKTYTPVKLGAEFAVGADPRAVGETFSVHVSVDGDTFQEWNTALLSSDTSAPMEGPMLLTISESYNGPEQIRFVRYSFGGNSKSGSAVSQLFAFARQKVKKPPMEICPALCSDGRHLVFLHASSVRSKDSGDKEKEYFLQAITLAMDPHDPSTTTVLSTVNFQWGLEEELLSQCTFACNSEKVLVLHRKGFASRKKEEKNADFNCRAFELSSGRQLSISGVTFAKSQGLPSGVCYDNRNNFIWSWDCVTSSVNRWRNDGLAPRFRTSLSETANPMLSSCPKCRLDAINTTPGGLFTSETEAALILCELDRISELYSPPTLPIAEADMTDKIEVVSVGSDDPGGGQCKILLRGQCCGPTERGFNIVVLNGQFGFGEIRSFDTVENENASERLADFIESIPEGKIVLVATQESASDKLTGRATTALRSIGADKIDRLGSRGAFAMVGRKGAAPGSVPQSLSERRKGPARARRLLPAPKIPLAVEASADTVSVLVKLTMVYYDNIKNGSTKELHKVMLLSCFRLLTTNIFQLLRGTPIKVACEAFQEEHRKSIMDIVTELIENPPATEGGATIASEALRLFTTSLDILYPSVAEKCALLVRYLESFAGGTLSSLQRSVLEILLRQMSAPSSLAMLLHSQEENASTDAGALFDSLLSIAKKETLSELEALVMEEEQEPVGMGTGREAAMGVSVGHKVGEAAVQMLQSLSNMVLSQSAQTVILEASDESKEEMSGGVEKSSTSSSSSGKVAVDLLKQMLEASGEILGNVLRVNESFLTAAGLSTEEGGGDLDVFGTGTGTRTRNTLHVDIEELVRVSPVGMLLPVILNAVAQLCQSQGSKMLSSGLDSLSPPLSVCIGHVHKCVTMIPKKTVNMASSEEGCFIKTETFESAHPYASNMDTTTEVSFPGAVKMTFTFDEQSKSENSYDYVKIWKTNDKSEVWHTDVEKYSGRGGSENWPGFGDRPPLVVHGDTACIEFHSDGSNEDWGWKVTVTAEFPTKGVVEQLHWMTQLERQLGYCGAVVISTLVKSLPSDPAMSSGVVWIEDELFSSNIVGMDEWQAEEDSFLKSLMDRSKTALALNFLSKMKNAVVEDLGTIEDINRATYATCAVLIRHAGLAKEALDVAKGTATTTTLSDELVRLWRIGQKIRLLPEFADAMPSMTTTTSTSGSVSTKAENKTTTPQKQHHMSITVGSGMTSTTTAVPDPCKQYTDGIIGRCQLLMRLDVNSALSSHFCDIGPRSSSHADGDSADIFADGIGSSAMDPLLEHEYELSTEGGSLDLASIRSLLVRYRGNRMSTVKSKSKITAGTVSILQSNDSNNNKPSSSSSSSHHVSIVEKILLFIQSSTSAEQLEAIRETRNRRAIYRIKGFEAAVALLSLSLHSPFTLCALLSAVSASLEATKYMPHATATNRVHYLNGIIGCSPGVRRTLSLAFATFLGATVGCMKNANIQSTEKETSQHSEAQQQQHEPVFWRVALLTSLKTCSLDYDAADHADLQSSGLLIEMERMLRSDDSDVSRAAWELLEKLLSNCVRKRSVSMVVTSDDRTTATDMTEDERGRVRLSAKLVSLLVTELQRASSGIFADKQLISVAADDFLPRSYDVVGGAVSVNRDCLGLAFPHTNPFGLSHSMSLWLRRDRSAIEDIIQSRTLRVGTRVSRGKSWSPDCLDDGGDNGFGTVVAVEQGGGGGGGATVDVKWDNSISKMAKKYSYGTVEEDGEVKFEVEIADEYLAGNIYQKGAMNSLEEELRGAVWSSFGLQLRGDASLRVFATSKLDRTWGLQSESRLVAEKWTHVAVVQTKEKCRLYIDGALDVETKMESYMVYPGKENKSVITLESTHPYGDNMDEYTPVEVSGALGYTLTFDQECKTEANYDFVSIYKDDSHSDKWGEDKYHGGRSGSTANWPGTNGRPPLFIPAKRFVLYFKSDGSNNDWGYKITVVADLPVVVSDEMEEIKELNTMPLYVGQAPSYASKAPSFSGGVCRFRLFDTPLSSEQIHRLAADSPPNDLDNIDDMQCLNVLSMLQRCSKQIDILDVQPPANENSNGNGNGDDNTSLMKNNNAEETILVPLLNIVVNGPVLGKIAGLRLCAKLLPPVPMSAIDSACSKVHFQLSLSKGEAEGRDRNSFIGFLTANIGAFLNVWWRRALTTVQSPPPSSSSSRDGYVLSSLPSSRMCEEIALGVAIEQVQLVRALLEHGDPWRECISAFVTDVVRNAPVTIDKLTNILNTHDPSQEQMAGDLEDCLVAVYAVVGLFGGMFAGLSPGSLAGYMRNGHTGGGEGSVEDCVVIAFTWPPSVKDETKEEEGWGDSNVFGDACMISLTSDPSTPLIVPSINLVSYREKTSAAFEEFVAEHAAALGTLFNLLLHMDTTDRRPLRLPKINESDEMIICESEHPYTDGLDTYQEVKLPGAKEIVITFDEQCRTENNCDYVTFYQDSTKSRFFGEGKYCGRDGTSNWPGTGDRAVLVIPAESFILHFHSDGSEHDWGYKFTAKAHCVVRNDPPPRPPLPLLALASHLKMLGMKALDARLQEGSGGVLVRHIIPSARALLAVALSPSHKVSTKGGWSKPKVFESNHPYDHNKDEYIPIAIKGAKRIVVTFDPRSATESGCDYIRFYKDDTRTQYWGESQYTGGKDGGDHNWPCLKGRPPLVINASSFVLYFHSDGSVNAWGWSITVRGEGLESSGGGNSHSIADSAKALLQFIGEGPARQKLPAELNDFPLAEPKSIVPLLAQGIDPQLLCDMEVNALLTDGKSEILTSKLTQLFPRVFTVNAQDASEVMIFAEQNIESAVLGKIPTGDAVTAIRADGDWLFVSFPVPEAAAVSPGTDTADSSASTLTVTEQTVAVGSYLTVSWTGPAPSGKDWIGLYEVEQPSGTNPSLWWVYITADSPHTVCTSESSQHEAWTMPATGAVYEFRYFRGEAYDLVCKSKSIRTVTNGWAKRRSGDSLYLVPADVKVSGSLVVLDEDSVTAMDSTSSSSSVPDSPHPMFAVEEVATTASSNIHYRSPAQVLWGKLDAVETTVHECTLAATTAFAQDAMSALVARWPDDVAFGTDSFGSSSNLMGFMSSVYQREASGLEDASTSVDKSEILCALRERLSNAVRCETEGQGRGEGENITRSLINYSLRILSEDVAGASSLRPTKAIVKTIEGKHPYDDNTDEIWTLSIPGAKSLKLVFDPKSSTEKDCDYCEIYKTAEKRDTDRLGSRYTGRAASGDKLWAGVNTPSLRVQSDTCVVSFHSDGSNTDWGFKLTCYGIMEEPTEDERAEFEARKQSSDSNVGLACWLLHSLANERQVPRVHKLLHTPSTWSLLRRFVDVSAVAADKRNMVVALVSKLVRAMSPGNIDDVLADELRHVVTSLKSILLQQHSKQTDEGKRVVTDFSPQLQSTADALLATIAILRDLTTSNDVHWDTAPAAGSDLVLSNDMRAVKLSENQTVRSQLRTATATATAVTVFSSQVMSLQSYSWNVKVSFTGPGNIGPSVGLASPHSTLGQELGLHKAPSTLSLLSLSLGWRSGQLHLNGMQPVAFGPLINTGDLVGITVTLSPFSVTFYRNSAKVGLAVGPPGSGAAIEIYLEVTQYRPAVSLFYPEDAALIRTGITSIGKDDSDSTDEIIPSWMRSLRQTSELISSCISSTPSSYFLQKDFRPLCEMKSSVTVETSHPYDGSTTATTATATATPFRQVVKIPHATRLTVFIDTSTALNENESVQISGSSCFGVETKTYLGLRGDGGAESRSGDVSVGDVVVRGPDWDWEDQDGGVGNFGDVTELRSWKGKLNKGAVVKWRASNESNLYRFGFEGLFDLTVVQEHNVKGVPMKDVFMGDEVTITIATSSIASSSSPDGSTFKPSFGLRCVVVPSFPMAHVLGNPSYRNLFDRVCYPYTVGGDPNEDGALVELVNRFVKEDSVLKSNWIQLVSAVEADGGNFSNHSERLKVLLAKPPLEISSDDQLVLGPGDMDSDTNVDPWNWGLQQTANSEGNAVRLGGDRGCKGTLYCGLPRDIPGTDGQCGPNNGRNCTSCRELQLCRPPLCGDEGHTLVISDYSLNGYTSGFSCNSCSKTTSRNNIGRTRWFCEACHYDLCFDCHPQFPTPRPRPTTNANNSMGALGIGSVVGASGSGVPIPTGDASPESVRMDFIVFLNRTVSSSLSLVDFSATSEVWTVASRLAAIRGVIFASVKKSLLDRALRASLNITDTAPKEIKLSKLKATRHQQSGVPDHEARYSIFAQVMRSLHFSPSDSLRVSEGTPMFAAVFEDGGGQSVEDAMTTCRRCFLTIAKELMSGALPLLLPLPSVASKRGDINTNNDTTKQQQLWALNPSATTETHLHMLTFLGKLMGVAIRANIAFPLHLAPIIWKLIVNENTSRNDLLELSPSQVPALVGLRKLFGPNRSEPDVSPENFSSLFRETFSCLSLDGQIVVELIPGGQEQPVTFDRVLEYCDRCESYRLHEMDTQVEAVRRGLAAVIPQKPLALFTGTQLRSMVSGEGLLPPDLSIDTKWIVKVVFREGAKVRGGLELSSDVVHSVDYNTTIEVLERRVNAENIPRLRTERGWMSEMLNPAAGSVGAVAELVPMRNALRMRVTDAPSCAIRQQPDHTAPEVGRLSIGDTVDVVQKLFSADNERWFRVLSPAGYVWWASALNDVFGLELVGLAPITHE